MVHAGDPASGDAAVAPFRALNPLAEAIRPMPYPAIYELTAGGNAPSASVVRSMFADRLDATMLERTIEALDADDAPAAILQIRVLGGALARVSPEATAFAHRERRLMVTLISSIGQSAGRAETVAWTEDVWSAARPFAGGVYSNFLEDEGEARIRESYPAATHARLAEIKRRYDPDNVFALNQNIAPAPR
jgi:hypothetical protein